MSVIQIVCIVLLVLILVGANAAMIAFYIKEGDWFLAPFPIVFLAFTLDLLSIVFLIAGALGELG